MARLPAGLLRVGLPATPADLARAEEALGRALPEVYASFLLSFDGADLFHEAIIVAGVGAGTFRALAALPQGRPDELVFAEALSGDRYALDAAGRVLRYDEGAEERALAGSDFVAWLVATVAREQLLFDPDGEYAPDVFDPEAQEVLPRSRSGRPSGPSRQIPGAPTPSMPAGWRWPTSAARATPRPPSPTRPSSFRRTRGPGSIWDAPPSRTGRIGPR